MQRAGRVGGDKLDLHLATLALIGTAKLCPLFKNALDNSLITAAAEEKIDKSRPGDFSFLYKVCLGQGGTNSGGNVSRGLSRHFCQSKSDIAGQVTVAFVARTVNLDTWLYCVRQSARGDK